MSIEILTGIDGATQRTGFQNATLQSAPGGLDFSIAIHIEVPDDIGDEEQLRQLLLYTLYPISEMRGVDIRIEIGPAEEDA